MFLVLLSAPSNVEAQTLALTQLHLQQKSLVCWLCRDDIGRMVKNPNVRPRWEKGEKVINCCIPGCNKSSFTLTKTCRGEQILQLFQYEHVPYPNPLCQQHYHFVYARQQPKYILQIYHLVEALKMTLISPTYNLAFYLK